MRLTEAEYRALVVNSPVLIWRAGLDGGCDYFNETWLAFTGRTFEQEQGNGWASGVHADDLQACFHHYKEHFERRASFEMEYRLRRHDGVYRWILDRGAPFFDDAGAFGGFIGSCVDVDDRRRAQEELARSGERALAVAQEFEQWLLGIVGHDIRNPLNAIAQASSLIVRAIDQPDVVQRNADRIARGVQRIKHLVDDLLDMTRERRGGIPIVTQPADLAAICQDVIDELSVAAPGRKLELACDGDARGRWDPHRMAQAISNLIGNAVQHGAPDTPVAVKISAAGDDVVVAVHNHGEVRPDVLPTIFAPSARPAMPVGRSSGLGLGLFIAGAIARAHGGSLAVESDAASGTTFFLRVPRTTGAPARA